MRSASLSNKPAAEFAKQLTASINLFWKNKLMRPWHTWIHLPVKDPTSPHGISFLTAPYHRELSLSYRPSQPWDAPCCWLGPQTGKRPSRVTPSCLQTNRLGRRGAAWPAWEQNSQTLTWEARTAARTIPLPFSQMTNQHSIPAGRQVHSPLSTARGICSEGSKKYQFVTLIYWHLLYFPKKILSKYIMLCIWDYF